MVITGIVIVVATFIAIIKQFETRLVLLLSGLLMCFIGGQLGAGTTAFVKELTNPGLVPTICTVLGFSYVMEYTKCTEHMVYFISAGLKKMTKIIIKIPAFILSDASYFPFFIFPFSPLMIQPVPLPLRAALSLRSARCSTRFGNVC